MNYQNSNQLKNDRANAIVKTCGKIMTAFLLGVSFLSIIAGAVTLDAPWSVLNFAERAKPHDTSTLFTVLSGLNIAVWLFGIINLIVALVYLLGAKKFWTAEKKPCEQLFFNVVTASLPTVIYFILSIYYTVTVYSTIKFYCIGLFILSAFQITLYILSIILKSHCQKALEGKVTPIMLKTSAFIEQSQASVSTEKNNVELLKTYKDLFDAGIITKEEFDQKKNEILKGGQ